MKKIIYSAIFVASVLIAFFVTKSFMDKSPQEDVVEPVDTVPAPIVRQDTIPQDSPSTKETDDEDVILDNPSSSISPLPPTPPQPTPPQPTPPPPTSSQTEPVKITQQEVKTLIVNGKYEKDARLSKRYGIEYVDVNDDDFGELQQNFTFVQQQVEFENWRDFEVVGLDYDESGKVNVVKIRPVY